MARAVPCRQDAPRRDRRGRSRERAPRPPAVGPRAPARRRGADPFRRADRDRGRDRLRGRGRAIDRAEGAGAVRPRRASRGGGRQDPADPASPVAGPPADPDHPRSARLLARLLGRGALGPARPLPAPLLAGGPGERRADGASQAARDVRPGRPGARHLDFLRSPRGSAGAPRIPGFWTVGLSWNSLDSLVRNEPFQWVTRDPGPFLFSGALSLNRRRKGRSSSIRRSTAPKAPRRAERAGQAGDYGSRHREGPIGHWEHITSAFPFWQAIVASISFHVKLCRATFPSFTGEGGAKRRMGCGPLPQP